MQSCWNSCQLFSARSLVPCNDASHGRGGVKPKERLKELIPAPCVCKQEPEAAALSVSSSASPAALWSSCSSNWKITGRWLVPLWARTVFYAAVNSILDPLAPASVPAGGWYPSSLTICLSGSNQVSPYRSLRTWLRTSWNLSSILLISFWQPMSMLQSIMGSWTSLLTPWVRNSLTGGGNRTCDE